MPNKSETKTSPSDAPSSEALDSIFDRLNRIPSSALPLVLRDKFKDLIQKRNYANVLLEACEICHAEIIQILFNYKEALDMSFSKQELDKACGLVLTSNKPGITTAAKQYILSLLDKQREQSPIGLTETTAKSKASSTLLLPTEAQFKSHPAVSLSSYGVPLTSPLAPGSVFILPPMLNQLLEEFNQIEMPSEWDLPLWISFKEQIQHLMMSRAYNKALTTACNDHQLETVKLLLKYKMALGMQFDDEVLSDCLAMDYFLPEAKEIASLVKGLMAADKRASTPPLPQTEAELKSQAPTSCSNVHLASPLEPGYVFILPPILNQLLEEFNQIEMPSTWDLRYRRNFKEKMQHLIMSRAYNEALTTACHDHQLETVIVLLKYKDALKMQFDDEVLSDCLAMDYCIPEAMKIASLVRRLMPAHSEAEFKSQPATASSSVVAEVSVRQETSALLTSSFFSNLKAQRLDLLLNELKQALSSLSIVDREEINKLILQEKYDMVLLIACKKCPVDVLRTLFKYKDSLNMNIGKNKLEEALNSVLQSETSNDAIIALLLEEQTKFSDEMQPH